MLLKILIGTTYSANGPGLQFSFEEICVKRIFIVILYFIPDKLSRNWKYEESVDMSDLELPRSETFGMHNKYCGIC